MGIMEDCLTISPIINVEAFLPPDRQNEIRRLLLLLKQPSLSTQEEQFVRGIYKEITNKNTFPERRKTLIQDLQPFMESWLKNPAIGQQRQNNDIRDIFFSEYPILNQIKALFIANKKLFEKQTLKQLRQYQIIDTFCIQSHCQTKSQLLDIIDDIQSDATIQSNSWRDIVKGSE